MATVQKIIAPPPISSTGQNSLQYYQPPSPIEAENRPPPTLSGSCTKFSSYIKEKFRRCTNKYLCCMVDCSDHHRD